MEGFLYQVAQRLYREYGQGVSSLYVVFPSRRARLFFSDALSKISEGPIWEPRYLSIDEVMGEMSDLVEADHVRLMTELYKVYSQFHQESFDSFYFWGEMLLADFDSIDKYLVDARMLFSNLDELKRMETDHSYLTEDQLGIITRFWASFGPRGTLSGEQQKFINIWSTLGDIYTRFRERLREAGMAYGGMIYRDVAERIKEGTIPLTEARHYVVAGFNALTECEKVVFRALTKWHKADFFWDYDRYYTDDPEQEAGLFLRENIRQFPQRLELPYSYEDFSRPKNITVVSAPSDSLQCRYAGTFLHDTIPDGGREHGKETAIVLTDENLLMPLLHSIPPDTRHINVTMGYPVRLTLAYSFVERLLELQNRKRAGASGCSFYHSDVLGLLSHPFVADHEPQASALARTVRDEQRIYVDSATIAVGSLAHIFRAAQEGWKAMAEYISGVLSAVLNDIVSCGGDRHSIETLSIIEECMTKLSNSLGDCGVEVSSKIFSSVLRKMLQNTQIPFEGEPLEGIQVMGILETRNLDFENILLLSVEDDTFPGNRAVPSSFIPNNLRIAYGLPTPRHHEGVYAYYFYRLLQRARNIHIVYSSKADMKSSGEQSRYIYQLQYESPHKLVRRSVGVDVGLEPNRPIAVEKKGEVLEKLLAYADRGGKVLSPTSFYNFIACPLKFYFHSIARLDPAEEITEEIDSPMFGSILHYAMRKLYEPLLGAEDPRSRIEGLINSDAVDRAVRQAVSIEFFHGKQAPQEDYGGNIVMVQDIVRMYINTCILPYDARRSESYRIIELESRVMADVALPGGREVVFGGTIDRVDMLESGVLHVVDYKTGREQLSFGGISSLFSGRPADLNSGVLQTLLYSMILNVKTGRDIVPGLYFVRNMNSPDYSPVLMDMESKSPVTSYLSVKAQLEEELQQVLVRLLNPVLPFDQCEDRKVCQWCDFNVICRR